MKTLNLKVVSFVSTTLTILCDEDRQPCWYADVVRSARREGYKWKVGRMYEGQSEEYEFLISTIGDVGNDDFWNRATGLDFAIELIDRYKKGGPESVKMWIKNGCL